MAKNNKLEFPDTMKLFKIHFDIMFTFEINVLLVEMLNIQLQLIP